MTDGVVSILPEPEFMAVLGLWDRLEACCGLNGVRITPFPHFSWQIGEGYDVRAAKNVLKKIAAETAPFEVSTSGIGIFPGPSPVVYLALTAKKPLLALHQRAWDAVLPLGKGLSPLYAPGVGTAHHRGFRRPQRR